MTVIDVHAHHTRRGYFDEVWWRSLGTMVRRVSREMGREMSQEEATEMFAQRMEALSGEGLVAAMDVAGIDRMVVLPLDYGAAMPDPAISIEQQNEEVAALCGRHPTRLIAFAGVDPTRGERAVKLFDRMVSALGARGLKVHPLAGFYPSQAEVYPLYERCQALDLPVLIHTGMDPAPLRSKYGRPAEVDEVANDFPDLRIVCAHMGGVWREEAVGVAQHHENVWLDVCGTESLLRRDRVGFYRRLREDLDILGADKLCFASDFPYYGSPAALGRWVRTFGEPSAEAGAAGITFSDEEIGGILHGNAERWLGASLSGAAGGSGES